MADKTELISQLRQRVAQLPPLPDEPDFNTSDETLVRFLKSRDWKLEEAARMLIDSIEYRRVARPRTLDCSWCHNRPGYHSMRQVGNDVAGRPVVYASFVQAATNKNTVEDSVAHVTYLIENAKRTMRPGVSTWVFVVDCTGMTLGACNPKIGYGMSNLLANHYPERLGMMVCVNHSPIFHGVWKAMKNFLCPKTVAKVRMVRSKARMAEVFSQVFDAEMSAWLQEEIALNKHKPLPRTQVEFWSSPPQDGKTTHDPRGCPSYVAEYVEGYQKTIASNEQPENVKPSSENSAADGEKSTPCADKATSEEVLRVHKPHPNVVDQLHGCKLERVVWTKEEEHERQRARSMVEAATRPGPADEGDEDHDLACDFEIPSDLQIPSEAVPLSASS